MCGVSASVCGPVQRVPVSTAVEYSRMHLKCTLAGCVRVSISRYAVILNHLLVVNHGSDLRGAGGTTSTAPAQAYGTKMKSSRSNGK